MGRWLLIAGVVLLAGCNVTYDHAGKGTEEKPEFKSTCGMDGYCVVWKLERGQYVKCADKVPPGDNPSRFRCEP